MKKVLLFLFVAVLFGCSSSILKETHESAYGIVTSIQENGLNVKYKIVISNENGAYLENYTIKLKPPRIAEIGDTLWIMKQLEVEEEYVPL